ncbi:MAG: hypothetical protein ACTSXQ_01920 [Alphaproteobacteria bacterium]
MALKVDFSKLDLLRKKMETVFSFESETSASCCGDCLCEDGSSPVPRDAVPITVEEHSHAPIVAYTDSGLNLDREVKSLEEGVEVLESDFEKSFKIGPDPQKLLIDPQTNLPVALYIPEEFPKSLQKRKGRYRKLHLTDCYGLRKMRDEGRFDRYRKSLGKGDLFRVKTLDGGEHYEKLSLCRYCLRQMNPNDYRHKTKIEKEEILQSFSIGDFLRQKQS